ncbi:MAG: glycosyltransferase [Spirochaetes bacterium]|nr:glycosyltransferase [Spirochaetota bacterium]
MKSKLVSVCTIAKNCADILPTYIAWALDNFEEINIIVDPESTDETSNMMKVYELNNPELNILGYVFDNFSLQKSRAINMATRPWVLLVDTDEIYEEGIPWDAIVNGMERHGHNAAAFSLYNLQEDIHHYRPPIEPKLRLMKRNIARMDGKSVDEGLDFSQVKVAMFDFAHIHFGHIRPEDALKLKGKDRVRFKDEDPCDGPGMKQYGDEWFIKRNEEFNQRITWVPRQVSRTIERYTRDSSNI